MAGTPAARAVGYCRVSTDRQKASGLGLDAQRTAITQTAARLQLPLVDVFTDALSGARSIEQRAALADALLQLRRGDVLIVAKRDRLARDSFLAVLIERAVEKKGARIVSAAGEGTDTDDPASTFTRRILDAVAELERGLIGARTRAALKAKRARGQRAGNLPFGYTLAADGQTLIPDVGEQRILALMRQLRRRGYTFAKIAASLNARGLVTRRRTPWQLQHVHHALKRAA